MVLVGLLTYGLAVYQTGVYEKEFPKLAKNDRELFLDRVNEQAAPNKEAAESTLEERNREKHVEMFHRVYSSYTYVGWVFMILGFIFMLLSTKEPQVPLIEDLESENEQ